MADSFFGFETSIPVDDDGGGGGLEDSEEDYDALNSETFGAATNGDWENIHENLVRLDRSDEIKDDNGESDLELNLSRVGMNDFDVAKEDNEGRIQLDPSVWANPFKSPVHQPAALPTNNDPYGFYRNPDAFLRQHFSNPFAAGALQQQQQQNQSLLHQQSQNGPPPQLPQSPQHLSIIRQQQQQQQLQQQVQQRKQQQDQQISNQMHNLFEKSAAMPSIPPHKIMSVEDIERNIRSQQKQTNQQTTPPKLDGLMRSQTPQQRQPINNNAMLPQQQAHQFLRGVQNGPPPGIPTPTKPPFSPLQLQNALAATKQNIRLPPGFPPMQQHNIGQQQQPPLPPLQAPHPLLGPHLNNMPMRGPPMNHNLPVALNNFAMHPNFNAMRQNNHQLLAAAAAAQQQQHMNLNNRNNNQMPPQMLQQQMLNSPHFQSNVANLQNSANFNQRLVQEIQQNHPMLPFNRMNNNFINNNMMGGMMGNQQQQQQHQQHMNNMQYQQQNGKNQHNNGNMAMRSGNGNLNEEYDEYANLMSNRDKQWLISIQLSQLNTGTPYIDDYYYTVFKERRSKLKGERENKAHKDNQLNHPFSQPKGHAHLVLISMGNKNNGNGGNHHHQRNGNGGGGANNSGGSGAGQHNRERKNSESNKDKETPRTYTPLQFENSLGKLQCGSVTAPRKIIDMDVVGPDSTGPFSTSIEITTQRKSRQLLMHIETLYRVMLKLEDLENPTAIATFIIVKERKEKERLLALEQQQQTDNLPTLPLPLKDIDNINLDSAGNSIRSSLSLIEKDEDDEDRDDLLPKLLAGLTLEKVAQMMTVRKGKTLLRRILPLIKDQKCRWDIWYAIFTSLPILVKKDRDDAEGLLFALFPEFKRQIQKANMIEIIKISTAFTAYDKKISYVFQNKFCISCVIVLILRTEHIYSMAKDSMPANIETAWLTFLTMLSDSAVTSAQSQQLGAAIQNDVIKPLVSHFSRFRDLKSQQLLAVLTQETI